MKEHPILFNTEMVQAIIDGRKTQTRRIMKRQPDAVERFHRGEGLLILMPSMRFYDAITTQKNLKNAIAVGLLMVTTHHFTSLVLVIVFGCVKHMLLFPQLRIEQVMFIKLLIQMTAKQQ